MYSISLFEQEIVNFKIMQHYSKEYIIPKLFLRPNYFAGYPHYFASKSSSTVKEIKHIRFMNVVKIVTN